MGRADRVPREGNSPGALAVHFTEFPKGRNGMAELTTHHEIRIMRAEVQPQRRGQALNNA